MFKPAFTLTVCALIQCVVLPLADAAGVPASAPTGKLDEPILPLPERVPFDRNKAMLGVNVGGNMFQKFGVIRDVPNRKSEEPEIDLGRYLVTGKDSDKYVFKVPSLRNAGKTAPYFHNAPAATLEDAVDVMIKYQLG